MERLVGVLLALVSGPALMLEEGAVTVQTVVTPTEQETTTRVALMADTGERVIGSLVLHDLVGVVQLVPQGPAAEQHAGVGGLQVKADICQGDGRTQWIRNERNAAGTARHDLDKRESTRIGVA